MLQATFGVAWGALCSGILLESENNNYGPAHSLDILTFDVPKYHHGERRYPHAFGFQTRALPESGGQRYFRTWNGRADEPCPANCSCCLFCCRSRQSGSPSAAMRQLRLFLPRLSKAVFQSEASRHARLTCYVYYCKRHSGDAGVRPNDTSA